MTTNNIAGNYELLLKNSLVTIKKLKADLEKKAATNEPIAVIGMSCRFPGGSDSPQKFWQFLIEGRDGIIEVPSNRWDINEFYDPNPGTSFKMYLKEAGFLTGDVGAFDARFFGISPLEASEIDPQQRLLLEVSWEALEYAGIPASQIKETKTGVFIGMIGSDYSQLQRNATENNPYVATGCLNSIASGRIAYFLGTHGPAITIDTACSSSLTAIHLACESLQKGESTMALAGGVNLMLSPAPFISLCKFNALANDGRCKTFDASGNGYGRGEGCGMVVLKKLSDAIRDKDTVLAIIHGTGVNNDGAGSGLTVPNGMAQKELIGKILAKADILPKEVSYLEAHGTGTALGDPIEMQALNEIFGNEDGREQPLIIGSVKSNIGHLEAASGVAGLIKVILCMQHKSIPPNLHLKNLNPKINLQKTPAIVPNKTTPWHQSGKRRIAGLSSFGFSGTNAHMVISEPMPLTDHSPGILFNRPRHIFTLSARDHNALSVMLDHYQDYLAKIENIKLEDICFTANTGRTHFHQRIAITASNLEELKSKLTSVGKITEADKNITIPKLIFLCNGAENFALVKQLMDTQPFFYKTLQDCDEQFRQLTHLTFMAYLLENDYQTIAGKAYLLDVTTFSVQLSLLKLWEYWGIKPNIIAGYGVGEYAAACVAGIMNEKTAIIYILKKHSILNDKTQPEGLSYPKIRLVAGQEGKVLEKKEAIDENYWTGLLAQPLKTDISIEYFRQQEAKYFLTIGTGSNPDLQKAITTLPEAHHFLLANDTDPWQALTDNLASLYCMGIEVNWTNFDLDYIRRKEVLPSYPFQRKRYWINQQTASLLPEEKPAVGNQENHNDPLEGKIIRSPMEISQLEYELSLDALPDLRDTQGLLHVGYYLEILGRAIGKLHQKPFSVRSIEFLSAFVVPLNGVANLTLILSAVKDNEVVFSFHSYQGGKNWQKLVQGSLDLSVTAPEPLQCSNQKAEALKSHTGGMYEGASFYQRLKDRGIALGESVQWIETVWAKEGEALARFKRPLKLPLDKVYALGANPGTFDACAQLFHAALPDSDNDMFYMVVKWEHISLIAQQNTDELWCHVTLNLSPSNNRDLNGTFTMFNSKGLIVAHARNCFMKGIHKANAQLLNDYHEVTTTIKSDEGEREIINRLNNTSPQEHIAIIEEFLKQLFGLVLKIEPSEIDSNESLIHVGLDSLVAMMAQNRIEKSLGIKLPVDTLVLGPSIHILAVSIINLLEPAAIPLPSKKIETGNTVNPQLWLPHRKANPQSKLKLFCFPYGGGGASVYQDWQANLPDFIEVCAVQLPGKEDRINEIAFADINEAVTKIAHDLRNEFDKPYAIYGHSMGALIAYRLACKLCSESSNLIQHLFVGAYTPPSILPNPALAKMKKEFKGIGYDAIPDPAIIPALSLVQAKELFDLYLSNLTSVSDDVNAELAKLLLPTALSELHLINSHTQKDTRVIDLPVTVIHGQKDHMVNKTEMTAWQELTTGRFELNTLSGDHMFLNKNQNQAELLALLSKTLKPYV